MKEKLVLPKTRLSVSTAAWTTLYFLVVSAGIFILWRRWAYDDPFITYRYANNLIHGLGFVYNPGERVLSTTTPLFTLILAGLSIFWKNIPQLANLVGALSIAAGAILLFDVAKSLKSPLVGWAALFIYPTFVLLLNTLGSETPLYIALALAAFAFYLREEYALVAVFSGFVVLTRPDGILIPAILGMDFLIRRRHPIPWKAVALFLLLILPWFIFSWSYFGSLVPSTLVAKQQQGILMISRRFPEGFLSLARAQLGAWHTGLMGCLALIGLVYAVFRSRGWLLFIAWPLIYFAAYSLLRVTSYFWYYAPLVPGYVALVGLGLAAIHATAKSLIERSKPSENPNRLLPSAIFGILLVALAAGQFLSEIKAAKITDQRYLIYREVGTWLLKNTPPDSKIGTLEVGIIGYFSNRPMIDFAGLIQPDVAERMTPKSTYEDSARFAIKHYQPRLIILHEGIFPDLEQTFVANNCEHVKTFEGAKFGYRVNLVVYTCDYH